MQTDFLRFRNHYSPLYKVLLSTLALLLDTEALPSYKLHTCFVSTIFLAVLSQPPCYRWITAFSQRVGNTFAVCFAGRFKIRFVKRNTRTVMKDVVALNAIPPFEWSRHIRLSTFACQGYSFYRAENPKISFPNFAKMVTPPC